MLGMSHETLKVAHFERVDENGDLVFQIDGHRFLVRVDIALERGILEAKQIHLEHDVVRETQDTPTIPISTIQSLIRAGVSPSTIAQNYNVSETLVRRFAGPVETEKKYAIDQFLNAPAPEASRNMSIGDVIQHSLAVSRINDDVLLWKATRRGREPWRIHASFSSAGRDFKAEWTWNMRDNSVTALNPTARNLLKTSGYDDADNDLLGRPFESFDGENTPSASSGTAHPIVDQPRHAIINEMPGTGTDKAAQSATNVNATNQEQRPQVPQVLDIDSIRGHTEPSKQSEGNSGTATESTSAMTPDSWLYADAPQRTAANQPVTADSAPQGSQQHAVQGTVAEESQSLINEQHDSSKDDKAKRRARRSAVPSWDEILFGE